MSVAETIADMRTRAERHERELRYGLRTHMIVRETEAEARQAADRLISKLDTETGAAIRGKSLDAASVGVQRQTDLRDSADDGGYAAPNLWTGRGRACSGAGAALVGDPEQIVARLHEYRDVGVDGFILSGYPHIDECDLVARHVLPEIDHESLKPRYLWGLPT